MVKTCQRMAGDGQLVVDPGGRYRVPGEPTAPPAGRHGQPLQGSGAATSAGWLTLWLASA
jgi:hypothetical protein